MLSFPPVCCVLQATLNVIRIVVLEVLDSNQKNRLLEEAGSGPSGPDPSHGSSLLQGEAELAYLTHEGLFISDALNEAQKQVQDQSSVVDSRIQRGRMEAAASDFDSGSTETSVSREQNLLYVTLLLVLRMICTTC